MKKLNMKMKPSEKPGKARRKMATPAPPNLLTFLVTTDFSGASLAGVRYALGLAEKLKAAVDLLHVVELPSWMDRIDTRTDAELIALARARLEKLAKREVRGDVMTTFSVRTGKPFHEITRAAREGATDLLVIATHGHSGFERAILGSTSERVVRHAPCPLLIVPTRGLPRRAAKAPPFKLKKILVPIDFSAISKDALPYAVLLAGHYGAELVLLHVVEKFPIDYLLGRKLMNDSIVPMMRQAAAELERIAGDLSKAIAVKATAVVRGKPFEEICHAAETMSADMIVLTTHSYSGLKNVWLGSTAERVIRYAPCPVLVVRAHEHDLVVTGARAAKPRRTMGDKGAKS